ncbi:HNH endonuclease [Nonomuraea cypriaca]|uniref:HNH endonuclease n=1 Tax=Nonomuraea cypriaca TaxID=1187855 RepID=UPI0038B334CE
MPLRPCGTCRRPVPDGRCAAHPPAANRYRPNKPRGPYGTAEFKRNRLIVLDAAGWTCVVRGCGAYADTADHITPWTKGGSSAVENLQAMCRPHNSGKRDR